MDEFDVIIVFFIGMIGGIVLSAVVIPYPMDHCQEETTCDVLGYDGYSEESDCCFDFTGYGTIDGDDIREYKCKKYGVSK